MGTLRDELERLEAVFKLDKGGKLVQVDAPAPAPEAPPEKHGHAEKPEKPKSWLGGLFGKHEPMPGKPSKVPPGPTGVGPEGTSGGKSYDKHDKHGEYKKPEKWTSAGGVVLGGEDDLEHVYIRKAKGAGYGDWTFPKGRIDKGESQEQTAVREVVEETGIVARIVPGGYLGTGEGSFSVTHYYLMYAVRDTGRHDEETEKVLLATWTEAMHKFAKSGNHRDIKILAAAMDKVEQIKRKKAAGGGGGSR